MWNIKQNFTGQIVFVPDRGIVIKSIIDKDVNYLLHYSFLLVAKPYGHFLSQDLRYIKDMIISGNDNHIFPTNFTAIIGNALILRFVINNSNYYDILKDNGISSYQKNVSSHLREYLCFGEFLRNVMQITELTKEIMKMRYPLVDKEPYDAIQLRMGGKLSDYPLEQKWLSKSSLVVSIQCIESHFKSFNIYIASDSMYAKKYMKHYLKNRNVSFVKENTLFSDTQVMNMNSVSVATYTAVADLYILGSSKSCIMTSGSTFAFAGCAISGNSPYTITYNGKKCTKL